MKEGFSETENTILHCFPCLSNKNTALDLSGHGDFPVSVWDWTFSHSIQISSSKSESIVIKCREVFSHGESVGGKTGNVQLDSNASRKGHRGIQSFT